MNISSRKTARTVLQLLIACAAATPAFVAWFGVSFPNYAKYGGTLLAVAAIVTKVYTAAEQAGLIKKFLDPAKAPEATTAPVVPYSPQHQAQQPAGGTT